MKFCPICKKMHTGNDTRCVECNKPYKEITDINEPVMLCVVGGMDRNAITGALRDAQIPFLEQTHGAQGVANEVVTGYDAKLLNICVIVPYSALPKAYEIAQAVGVADESMEEFVDAAKADIDEYKSQAELEDDNKMSDAKRTTIKVITALLFLALVALVVWGTDYFTDFIKNLFGGN